MYCERATSYHGRLKIHQGRTRVAPGGTLGIVPDATVDAPLPKVSTRRGARPAAARREAARRHLCDVKHTIAALWAVWTIAACAPGAGRAPSVALWRGWQLAYAQQARRPPPRDGCASRHPRWLGPRRRHQRRQPRRARKCARSVSMTIYASRSGLRQGQPSGLKRSHMYFNVLLPRNVEVRQAAYIYGLKGHP